MLAYLPVGRDLIAHEENKRSNNEHGVKMSLLEAGIALFSEKGYASTAVREIVALAGVTKPVLYYYFRNKEGLFRAILDAAAERQKELLAEALGMTGTVLERLSFLHRRIYQELSEKRDLFRMIHNLIFGPPQGVPSYDVERYHEQMLQAVKDIYEEGMQRGEVKETDPEEVSMMVVGLTDYCFHLDYLYPENMDPGRAERLLGLAFRGLLRRNDHEDEMD
jgi:TetR/AcrR family transcriptional regulator